MRLCSWRTFLACIFIYSPVLALKEEKPHICCSNSPAIRHALADATPCLRTHVREPWEEGREVACARDMPRKNRPGLRWGQKDGRPLKYDSFPWLLSISLFTNNLTVRNAIANEPIMIACISFAALILPMEVLKNLLSSFITLLARTSFLCVCIRKACWCDWPECTHCVTAKLLHNC